VQEALTDLSRLAEKPDGLREIASCPQLFPVVFTSLRTAAASGGTTMSSLPLGPQLLKTFGELLSRCLGTQACHTIIVQNFTDYLLLHQTSRSRGLGPRDAVLLLQEGWPGVPIELRTALGNLLGSCLVGAGSARSSAVGPRATLLVALLEGSVPEELQVVALRSFRIALDGDADSIADEGNPLTPKVANAALLRLIPRHPLICLDILGALALKDHFRSFLGTQTSLLKFLAHCCHQPVAAAASNTGVGYQQPEAAELQRAAAKCLAHLSSHAAVRDWAQGSTSLRGTLANADDLSVRAYLGVVLDAETR